MARVFVQEAWQRCKEQNVNSRYEMILLASHRSKQLLRGAVPLAEGQVQRGQAPTVNALRDFETGNVDFAELKEDLISSMQNVKNTAIQEEE